MNAMTDHEIIQAEKKYRIQLLQLASAWINLKEVRLRKLFRSQNHLGGKLHSEYQKLEQSFIEKCLKDPQFQVEEVGEDVSVELEEVISSQVNKRYGL